MAEFPDEKIIKLSDAYENTEIIGMNKQGNPALELEVKVINIKQGRNEKIVKKCKTLAGYSAFVAKVHEYELEKIPLEEAIKKAVEYFLENDILKEFLEQNSSAKNRR